MRQRIFNGRRRENPLSFEIKGTTVVVRLGAYTAYFDTEDWIRIGSEGWYISGNQQKTVYIFRGKTKDRVGITAHRAVMRCAKGDGKIVDHINRNTLDNRKENLRLVGKRENSHNSIRGWGRSKHKGVCWFKPRNQWMAKIRDLTGIYHCRYFKKEKEALVCRLEMEKKYLGEYAPIRNQNQPRKPLMS